MGRSNTFLKPNMKPRGDGLEPWPRPSMPKKSFEFSKLKNYAHVDKSTGLNLQRSQTRHEQKKFPMAIYLETEKDGRVHAVHVSEKQVSTDYEEFVPAIGRLVRQHGKLGGLFDMANFHS